MGSPPRPQRPSCPWRNRPAPSSRWGAPSRGVQSGGAAPRHVVGGLWRLPVPLSPTWESLKSSEGLGCRPLSLPEWALRGARGHPTTILGAPLPGVAPGWGGLAPKLARPARPLRRLLLAPGAARGNRWRRAQPGPPPARGHRWGEWELRAPVHAGAGGLGRSYGPRGDSGPGRQGTARRAPLDEVPQRRPGPLRSSSCPTRLPPIWGVLWGFLSPPPTSAEATTQAPRPGGRFHGVGQP